MKRTFLFLLLGAWSSAALPQAVTPNVPAYVPDQVVVAFQPGASTSAIAAAHRQVGARELRRMNGLGAMLVQVGAGRVPAAIAAYGNNPNVRFAEPNYIRLLIIPNEGQDPPPPQGLGIDYFAEQYGLQNTGQPFYYDEWTGQPGAIVGEPDADIDAPEAWDIITGDASIKVAVLDSGIDCQHPDLVNQCVEIMNFGPSSTTEDEIGHGTHVAGIIGATGNNGDGVAGVSWNTSIGNLKVCYEYYDIFLGLLGLCDSAAAAAGMEYAADNGYHVINMSFAGPEASQIEAAAATYAWNAGVVLVAAAGNGYSQTPVYPANFPEVIAVAATDWFDNLASFSNFGNWVSLAAPGAQTFSTMPHAACGLAPGDPEGCYGWLSGTSMASPTVAGAAALVWAQLGPGATNALVRSALENNADTAGARGQNMLAWTQNGRLNLHASVVGGGSPPPPPPPAGPGVHVGDLDGANQNQGPNWMAQVTITVHHDDGDTPATGYTVNGSWGGGATGPTSCVTQNGQCTITSDPMLKRNVSSVTYAVTSVTGAEPYNPAANHDPDPDSDGTSIDITR